MKLSEIMTTDVEVISPEGTVQEAAEKMKRLNVGSIPVCDGDRLLGMLTDRDIAIRAVAGGMDPNTTRARQVMTPGVVYCYDDQEVKDAANLMAKQQIRRLPIVNREKSLVGIVSLGDVSVDGENQRLSGETLEKISTPSRPAQ